MTPLMVGALSGGVSFLSGLFGRSDAKKQHRAAVAAQAQYLVDANRAQEDSYLGARAESVRARAEFGAIQAGNYQAVAKTNRTNVKLGNAYRAETMVHLDKLVRDAEAAGFNPLTVMRSGGMALYSKQVNLPGYQLMSPETFQRSAGPGLVTRAPAITAPPVLSSVPSVGSVAMGAVQDGFSKFMDQARYVGTQEFQRELLNRTLLSAATRGVQKGRAAGNSVAGTFGHVPAVVSAGGRVDWKPPTPEGNKLTSPWLMWKSDPTVANAESFTNRMGEGELAESAVFLKNSGDDFLYNLTGKTAAQRLNWTLSWFNPIKGHPASPRPYGEYDGPLTINVVRGR